MGDVLLTLPAVHHVREVFPEAKISFLVSQENAPLLRGFRQVDRILTLDRVGYRKFKFRAIFADLLGVLWSLRRERFSLSVDFQGYGETALLSRWSGATHRWGVAHRNWRKLMYTRWVPPDCRVHTAEFNLTLLQSCGLAPGAIRNELELPAEVLDEARAFLRTLGLDPAKRTLFIQPLTSSPRKNWGLENYLVVARQWRDHGLQIIFGGGPGDKAALEPIRASGFPVCAGVPLLVSAGLIDLSTLVLGGDTGLLHAAVAMGRRVVMLMSSTKPGSCPPFQHVDWALVPTQGTTVSSISVEAVNDACARALG